MNVKLIEALRTPQTEAFLKSLPVCTIRILDLLASGEAKLLYHSIAEFVWNVINVLGQEETTIALAEFTALFVNALQKERECHGSWSRQKHRGRGKKRRVKVASLEEKRMYHSASPSANVKAKRRRERNKFMKQTYTDRVLLSDDRGRIGPESYDGISANGSVEDAILSSLGESNNNKAWLTFMGRGASGDSGGGKNDDGDDAASLPSKVVLPRVDSRGDVVGYEDSIIGDLNDSLDIPSEFGEEDDRFVGGGKASRGVNVTRLREGIKMRAKKNFEKHGSRNNKIDNKRPPSTFMADGNIYNDADIVEERDAIEDLVMSAGNSTVKSPAKPFEKVERSTKERHLAHEDLEVDASARRESLPTSRDDAPRGSYSSVVQFRQALEDFQARLMDESDIKDSLQTNGPLSALAGSGEVATSRQKERPAIKSLTRPKEEKEKEVNLLDVIKYFAKAILGKNRVVSLVVAFMIIITMLIWIALGCFGLYFIITHLQKELKENSSPMFSGQSQLLGGQNEIILKIVDDASLLERDKIITAAVEAIREKLSREDATLSEL